MSEIDYDTPQRQKMRLNEVWRKRSATWRGYFWLPCPICGMQFGGNEIEGGNIPDPDYPPQSGRGVCICPACDREGRGASVEEIGFVN